MSLERTVPGHIEGITWRGRRAVLLVAVPKEDADRLIAAIGHEPARHHAVPVVLVLGRAAEVLGDMAGDPPAEAPVVALPAARPRPFDLGAAVAAIAEATLALHLWTDLVAGQPIGAARMFADKNRAERAEHLRELQDELTAEFRAAVSGRPA